MVVDFVKDVAAKTTNTIVDVGTAITPGVGTILGIAAGLVYPIIADRKSVV